jgi:hypothetical protein
MLKVVWLKWKGVANAVGTFQARILLTIFYGVLVLPFGIFVRFFSDPLRIRRRPTQWLELPNETQDLNWAKRQ